MLPALLLTLSLGVNPPAPDAPGVPDWGERSYLKSWAVRTELLDPRECQYVFVAPADLAADVRLLRRRVRELAGTPPLGDVEHFPDRPALNASIAFNRSYLYHLQRRREVETGRWLSLNDAACETERLYQVYDAARDAGCDDYDVGVRRQALARLRDWVGEEAYAAGRLPPPVPVWRFERIR